jgi:Cyclic nucleotide-binding domain
VLAEAARRSQRWHYRRGEVIVEEGAPADRVYLVISGEAEVTKATECGETFVATIPPGGHFGEVGLLASLPRNASVRAVGGVELATLEAEDFRWLVESSKSTAEELAQVAERRSTPPVPRGDAVPLPPWTRLVQRVFKHPRATHYNRLIALVLAGNLAVLWYGLAGGGWWSGRHTDLASIALIAQLNLGMAILLRQPYVINALGRLAMMPPASWPLRLRWAIAKWYHFGGLHVGAALAGTAWYAAFAGSLIADRAAGRIDVPVAIVMLACVGLALFVVIAFAAAPGRRMAAHDDFEFTHRFGGWAALLIGCVTTVLFVASQRGSEGLISALLRAPTVWILVGAVGCAAWPWLLLRRVRIDVALPSAHTALVTLDPAVRGGVGTTRAISRTPFAGWHQFANLPPTAGRPGYRMVVSRAGDWTSAFIEDPPAHVWVRGIPTIEMANVRRLFRKTVFVATGSGIAPVLGHLLSRDPPSRLVWVTRDPRLTYGDALLDEILDIQRDALIWNTDERGRPDVLRLAYAAYRDSGAEAVICVSNKQTTWDVVHGLERRGIPAFGPLFDS